MEFYTREKFLSLTDIQKSDYYSELCRVRDEANTVSEYETLIIEFEKLDYHDSAEVADELRKLSYRQRKLEEKEFIHNLVKGGLITLAVILGVALVVTAVMIAGMF